MFFEYNPLNGKKHAVTALSIYLSNGKLNPRLRGPSVFAPILLKKNGGFFTITECFLTLFLPDLHCMFSDWSIGDEVFLKMFGMCAVNN